MSQVKNEPIINLFSKSKTCHFYAIWKEKEKSLIKLGQGEGKVKLAEKQVGKDKYPLLTDILVMFFWEPALPIWQFPLFDILQPFGVWKPN